MRTPANVTPPVAQLPPRAPGCRGGHAPPELVGPVGCAAWLMSVSFLPPRSTGTRALAWSTGALRALARQPPGAPRGTPFG